ncbi:hypothetical protein CCACVL1_06181 [Corchorus capsularis]|uniref:Uncharacterized protein n=1 Tax=Corchorus capsularis TaxID=210143 RepID=A0A1R3JGY9_COCAP|nr:hypothetical protein CCACVL1_06181 [Corchorus capsularis]
MNFSNIYIPLFAIIVNPSAVPSHSHTLSILILEKHYLLSLLVYFRWFECLFHGVGVAVSLRFHGDLAFAETVFRNDSFNYETKDACCYSIDFALEDEDSMFAMLLFLALSIIVRRRRAMRRRISYSGQFMHRHNIRSLTMNRMVFDNDIMSMDNCRMDRRALAKLCHLLRTVGKLKDNRNSTVEMMVGCLGALDGTYIKVHVDTVDRPRYRTGKGEIATNVLGILYGKDRATGAGAETPADACEIIDQEEDEDDEYEDAEADNLPLENDEVEVVGDKHEAETEVDKPDASQTFNTAPTSKKAVPVKKRSRSDDGGLSDLVASINNYVGVYRETNEHIKGIATYFQKQSDGDDRRMLIFEEIMQMGEFTNQEVMDASENILKDAHKVDSFFGLPNVKNGLCCEATV